MRLGKKLCCLPPSKNLLWLISILSSLHHIIPYLSRQGNFAWYSLDTSDVVLVVVIVVAPAAASLFLLFLFFSGCTFIDLCECGDHQSKIQGMTATTTATTTTITI